MNSELEFPFAFEKYSNKWMVSIVINGILGVKVLKLIAVIRPPVGDENSPVIKEALFISENTIAERNSEEGFENKLIFDPLREEELILLPSRRWVFSKRMKTAILAAFLDDPERKQWHTENTK